MKRCFKCKKIKPLTEFEFYKIYNKYSYYNSYCNECKHLHRKERRKIPWIRVKDAIGSRCNATKTHYFERGIKNKLTLEEIKTLWFRDKAYSMKRPSIHRIDNDKNYTFNNCQFMELSKNISLGQIEKHKIRIK